MRYTNFEKITIFKKGAFTVATTKAQQKAVNKYIKKNYDRINVTIPKNVKENKSRIEKYAKQANEKLNVYIRNAIEKRMASEPVPEAIEVENE